MKKQRTFLERKILTKKYLFKGTEFFLKKSLSKNFFLEPKVRLSFLFQKEYFNKDLQFYSSQNKLYCIATANKSVVSRRYMMSRFYLTFQLNRLTMHNTVSS